MEQNQQAHMEEVSKLQEEIKELQSGHLQYEVEVKKVNKILEESIQKMEVLEASAQSKAQLSQ